MRRRLPRWRRVSGAMALAIAVLLPGIAATNASWVESEYGVGTVASLQCAGNTDLSSRATARFITGTINGSSLDTVAGVTGITVSNDGTSSAAVAGNPGATALGGDAYVAPISASAINGSIAAGTGLGVPIFSWPVGAYQQYGQALDSGISTGAAGAVTNGGAIDTEAGTPGAAPTTGSLSLSSLPGIGSTLGSLTGVGLTIGAVASATTLDGCSLAWTGGSPSATQLQRSYYVDALSGQMTSSSVAEQFGSAGNIADLVSAELATEFATDTSSGEAETAISLAGLTALSNAVSTGLLSPLLSGLPVSLAINPSSPSQVSTTSVIVNMAPVTSLLSSTISDGVVTVNLANGAMDIDIAALSGGLDNRPPNTSLLTAAELADVSTRVNSLLEAQIANIENALRTALETATVTVNERVILRSGSTDVVSVAVSYTGTLKQFVDGTAATPLVTVTGPTVTVLGSGLTQTLLNAFGITTVLATVLGTVASTTTAVLDAAQAQAYDELLGAQLTTLLASAGTLEDTAMSVLAPLLDDLGTALSITINVQPDMAPYPPAPTPSPQTGEYFVSALRIGMNDASAASILDLWYATSSAGRNAG